MSLDQWYQQPIGRHVHHIEQQWLQSVLPQMFGYYIVQLGNVEQTWLDLSPIRRHIYFAADHNNHTNAHITGDYTKLPFATASIDAMVISHILEFSRDPLAILSEIYRCLLPEGKLFILGLNSCSLWGIYKLFHSCHAAPPWGGNFIRPARLRCWLQSLGYSINNVTSLMQRPPLNSTRVFKQLAWLDTIGARYWPEKAGCYAIIATKSVIGLTPRRPLWRRCKTLFGKTPASPSWRVRDPE